VAGDGDEKCSVWVMECIFVKIKERRILLQLLYWLIESKINSSWCVVSGNADSVSGNADSVSGNADTVSGNVDSVSGNADSVSGNADSVSGNADSVFRYGNKDREGSN